jgi:hypothetical protein
VCRLQVLISCRHPCTSSFGVQRAPCHVLLRFQLFDGVETVTLLRCVQIRNRGRQCWL